MIAGRIDHPWPEPPAEGEAIDIAPGIKWMRLPLPMRLDHVNVFALDDGAGWTVVDTGFDSQRARRIWQALLDGPLAEKPVTRVIVTHHHPDHIGLAGWFIARGAELWTTRTAWLTARMLVLDDQDRPAPEALAFLRAAGMPPELLAKRAAERPFNFVDVVHPLPSGYRRIQEGDLIEAGQRSWRVVIGHGHAPEHATFWSESDNLVLGGDQLLPRISPNLGVHPTEPEADPVGEWMASCTKLLNLAHDAHIVLPGHHLPFTGLPLRLTQLRDNHVAALDRLVERLQRPATAVGCFDTLFKRPIGEGEFGLALAEAVGHINHLAQKGLITQAGLDDHGGVLWSAVR